MATHLGTPVVPAVLATAYASGAAQRASGVRDVGEAWINAYGWFSPHDADTRTEAAFFVEGFRERPLPRWVTGWRYGDIPASGVSTNYRDNRSEGGVSMMQLDGDDEQTDGTFALFNGGRDRVRVGGWLIEERGADGEPLIVGAVAL